jgi:hypothetical protein
MALTGLGRVSLYSEDKEILLPLIAKTEGDRKRLLMKDGFENLVELARKNAEEMIRLERVGADLLAPLKKEPATATRGATA